MLGDPGFEESVYLDLRRRFRLSMEGLRVDSIAVSIYKWIGRWQFYLAQGHWRRGTDGREGANP